MQRRTIHHVDDLRHLKAPQWHIFSEDEEGGLHALVVPDTIFEIRAGEYGIDPHDIETLLDVVLHEPALPDPAQPRNHDGDPAAAQGHVVRARFGRDAVQPGRQVPAWLYNADSIEQARTAHLLRIEHCKKNLLHIHTQPGDALDAVRAAHKPSPAACAAIAAHVATVRSRLAAQPKQPSPKSRLRNHPLADFLEQRR